MSSFHGPELSEHGSESAKKHMVTLATEFVAMRKVIKTIESRVGTLPKSLGRRIFKGISEDIAEAASSGLHLDMNSEFDRQLLAHMIYERIMIQAAAKARERVPVRIFNQFAKACEYHLTEVFTWGMALMKRTQESDEEGEEEDEADEEIGADEKVGAEEEDGAEEEQPEENIMTNPNEPSMPQERTTKAGVYDPKKGLDQCEPLAHSSDVTFKINSQAAVNVLYDMSPLLLRNSVCVAIQKKLTPEWQFLGSSYLSDARVSEHGHICAKTYYEREEDVVQLSEMSNWDWDRDIIDHGVGINFGTAWRYRVLMKGFNKESSLGVVLGLREQKAALVGELVRTNITTFPSLRIHHIKDVRYRRGSDGEEALAVDFFDIDQTLAAISQGLCYKGVRYDCETLEPHRFLARCEVCQAVGHPASGAYCIPRCGSCSERHQTQNCPKFFSRKTCALCGGPHASDNPDCPRVKAKPSCLRFGTVSSREVQLMMCSEMAVPPLGSPGPASLSNGGRGSDAPRLLARTSDLRQSSRAIEASLDVIHRNSKDDNTKKRGPLEPLVNGGASDAVRSPKRIKEEEQQGMENDDLYSEASP